MGCSKSINRSIGTLHIANHNHHLSDAVFQCVRGVFSILGAFFPSIKSNPHYITFHHTRVKSSVTTHASTWCAVAPHTTHTHTCHICRLTTIITSTKTINKPHAMCARCTHTHTAFIRVYVISIRKLVGPEKGGEIGLARNGNVTWQRVKIDDRSLIMRVRQ